MFQIDNQYLDTASGFHVIQLRDQTGTQHLVQLAVGQEFCPMCGHAYPSNAAGAVDPKALVTQVTAQLNHAQQTLSAYAKKHGLTML